MRRVVLGLSAAAVALAGCSNGSHSQAPETSAPSTTRAAPPTKKKSTLGQRPDGHGRTFVVPTSIEGNCSIDVTSELQSWLDSSPDDARLELRRGACFRIEGTLVLSERPVQVLTTLGETITSLT